MGTLTTRLDLIKPSGAVGGDNVDIDEINDNFDAIDQWLIPAAKLRRTTGAGVQAITSGSTTVIDFNTAVYDSWSGKPEGAMADAAANTLRAPLDGLYLATVMVGFAANGTGIRALMLEVNTVVQIRKQEIAVAAASQSLHLSWPLNLTAADLVRASVVQTSGGSLNIDPALPDGIDACSLTLQWMGKKV